MIDGFNPSDENCSLNLRICSAGRTKIFLGVGWEMSRD